MSATPNPNVDDTSETIVGTIDPDTVRDEYVIADISADDAWLSMCAEDAPTLPAWR